jgi:hypothetical protein
VSTRAPKIVIKEMSLTVDNREIVIQYDPGYGFQHRRVVFDGPSTLTDRELRVVSGIEQVLTNWTSK